MRPAGLGCITKTSTRVTAEVIEKKKDWREDPKPVYKTSILRPAAAPARAPPDLHGNNSNLLKTLIVIRRPGVWHGACSSYGETDTKRRNQKVAEMTEKAKILVVDDDETVRRSYLRSLNSAFRSVEAAGDGEGALRAMEKDRFDVVLLDLRMPGTDGIAVLKTMKQRWPESEVVVITGYPTIETVKEAVRLGAYDYLAKPVGPADVINATDGAMTQKRWTLHQDATSATG
jgi:CheY-like chemotaxis protein